MNIHHITNVIIPFREIMLAKENGHNGNFGIFRALRDESKYFTVFRYSDYPHSIAIIGHLFLIIRLTSIIRTA